jgi:hypothetical protein
MIIISQNAMNKGFVSISISYFIQKEGKSSKVNGVKNEAVKIEEN